MQNSMKSSISKAAALLAVGLCMPCAAQSYFYKDFDKMSGTQIGHNGKYAAVPRNENAGISAMALAKGSVFHGGTHAIAGRPAWLFEGDVEKKDVAKAVCLTDKVPNQSIVTCLKYDAATGTVYGSTRNLRQGKWLPEFDFQEITTNMSRDENKEKDIRPPAGHLFMFTSLDKITDLGVAVDSEGVYSFVLYKPGNAIYGITDHWKLFKFDLAAKKSKIVYDFLPVDTNEHNRSRFRFFGEKLIIDKTGAIWGTGFEGQFFTVDVKKDTIQYHDVFLPSIRGREQINGVQSWVLSADSIIYGGTRADGILVSFDPAKKICRNLGKPNYSVGMPGIAVNKFNLVYMLAGNRDNNVHIMAYDAKQHYYIDYGVPHVKIPAANYSCRTFQLGPCFFYKDTTLVIGDNDRDGHVVFITTGQSLPKQQGYPKGE